MLDRLQLLIGNEPVDKIKSSNIVVLGLGGVGGYVVESLIRSGISNMTIIDYDKIELSNLNRQIISNIENIGKLKTEETKKRILSINEKCNVFIVNEFIDESNIDDIFLNDIDYFIDACDSLNTKKLVIDKCLSKNIKLITCMGTGNRMVSDFEVIDIRKTKNDPVAKVLRKHVNDLKINKKVMCLCSKSVPIRKGEIIGSNSFVPAIAGLKISEYVINDIIQTELYN